MEVLQYVIDTQTTHLLEATVSQTERLSEATASQTERLSEAMVSQTHEINEQLSKTGVSQATANTAATKAQTVELEKQRKVVTTFTILTTLFLPLGFCTSVGFRNSPNNSRRRLANGCIVGIVCWGDE